jgi:hypothetical protein
MKLAILIPTIEGREHFLEPLLKIFEEQRMKLANPDDVIVLVNKDQGHMKGGKSTGVKRNELEAEARLKGATHRVHFDDDDKPSDDYIELNMPGVYLDYDCNSLIGIYYENGNRANRADGTPKYFKHSIEYGDHVYDNEEHFIRPPNHISVTKLSKLEGFLYQDKSQGEDMELAVRVARAGVLKTEYKINKPYYHYYFRTKHNGI